MVKGTRAPGKFCIVKFSKQKQIELFRFTRKRYVIYDVKEILQTVDKKRSGFCFICPKDHQCKYEVTSITGFLKHVKELEIKLSKQLLYFVGERKVRLRGPRSKPVENSESDSYSSASDSLNKLKDSVKQNLNGLKLNNSIRKKEVIKSTTKSTSIQNGSKLTKQTKSANLSINKRSKTISKLNKSNNLNGKKMIAGYERSYQVIKDIKLPLKSVSIQNISKNSNKLINNFNDQQITPKSKSTKNNIFTSTPIPILSPVINLFSKLIPYSNSK